MHAISKKIDTLVMDANIKHDHMMNEIHSHGFLSMTLSFARSPYIINFVVYF
jgi:hypothetical protein